MFGLFEHKISCPSCNCNVKASHVKVSKHRKLKVFNCTECKADFINNRRNESFRILDEGVVLC